MTYPPNSTGASFKPTLLILAAGSATRYGGLKQLEPIGPNGECIMEYSIYDALKAGFGKIVTVIREEHLHDFELKFFKLNKQVDLTFAFQQVNPELKEIQTPVFRNKPWGTVNAVLSATHLINEPFAVVNADDFYGREAYVMMHDFLINHCSENHWAMIGYRLGNTLSDYGGVTRGVCDEDEKGLLKKIKERRGIQRLNTKIIYTDSGMNYNLIENASASMNFWGFHERFLEMAEKSFLKFATDNSRNADAEMTLPDLIQPLIETGLAEVSILHTSEQWFGLTFKSDFAAARTRLKNLIDENIYPKTLL